MVEFYNPKKKKTVLIDCDPGIDDALALLFAFASPEIKVDAITAVYGNAALSQTLKNVLNILKVAGIRSLPDIGRGCPSPLKGRRPERGGVHGANGLANTNLGPADLKIDIKEGIDLIIEKALGNKIDSVIALGPLTNIATAILKEPKIKEKIDELIIVGGILHKPTNVTSYTEFNINCDPDAARKVFQSKIPIKLISLDVTQKVMLKEEHIKPFEQINNALSRFIVKIARFFIDFHKNVRKKEGAFLNDPLAVGIALESELGSFEDLCLDVSLDNEKGRLLLKKGEPNVSFCKSVKTREFLTLFVNRLLTYCRKYQ